MTLMMMMIMIMVMIMVTRWGIWREDPGPRGVHITDWSLLEMMGGLAPSGWTFDSEVMITLVIMMMDDNDDNFDLRTGGWRNTASSWRNLTSLSQPASMSAYFHPASKHIVHLLPGLRYVVTGGRETQAVLTIHPDGDTWELGEGASLHDVTHLPCRSGNQSLAGSPVAVF